MSGVLAPERLQQAWTCSACGVRVRNASGEPIPLPSGWSADEACIRCQQRALVEGTRSQEERIDLVRFELLRGRGVNDVAATSRVQRKRVAEVRRDMIANGDLSQETGQPAPSQHREREASDLDTLRRLGPTTSRRFAQAIGASMPTAKRRLAALRSKGWARTPGKAPGSKTLIWEAT